MYLRSRREDHERTLMGVMSEDDSGGDGGIGGGSGGGGGGGGGFYGSGSIDSVMTMRGGSDIDDNDSGDYYEWP